MKGEKYGKKNKKKTRISGAPSQGAAYRAVGSMRFARQSVSWISFQTVTSMDFTEVTVSLATKG